MKKIILVLLSAIVLTSCLNNNDFGNYTLRDLPIDSYTVPDNFTFGERDTIAITYTLPDGCHSFDGLFYQIQDTSRIVAVRAFVNLDTDCTTSTFTEEYKFPVLASQEEDYLFKFFIGVDEDGEYIFEEVIVPVN